LTEEGKLMAVLTFSRTYGCGVRELGRELARELNYMYFGKELIPLLFKKIREEKKQLREQQSWGDALSKAMINFIYTAFPFIRIGPLQDDIFSGSLKKVIIGLADKGNVIILGRGGQIILEGYPNTFHIRFTADLDYRIDHIQKYHNPRSLNQDAIIKNIRQEDKCRKDFIKYNFNRDIDDSELYDLIIDVGKTSKENVKQLIKDLIPG
jgi:hypothetical protein